MSILRDKLTEELGRCWRTRGIVLPVLRSKPTVLVVFVWNVCGFFRIVDRNRAQTIITVRILCQSLPKFGDSNNVGSWYNNCTIQCTIHLDIFFIVPIQIFYKKYFSATYIGLVLALESSRLLTCGKSLFIVFLKIVCAVCCELRERVLFFFYSQASRKQSLNKKIRKINSSYLTFQGGDP